MNKFFTIVTLIIIVSSLAFGYQNNKQDDLKKIVGVWTSAEKVNDEPQAVVKIANAGKKLEGDFIFGGLTVEGQDNKTLEFSMTNISFDGTTLSFQVTFPGPENTVADWELKLRSDNEAGLAMTKEDGRSVEGALSFAMKREKTD